MASNNNNVGISKVAAQRKMQSMQAPQYVHGTTDDTSGIVNVGRLVTESVRSRQLRTLVGRNDLCPCGSLLKFKKCHGRPKSPPSMAGKKRPTMSTATLLDNAISLAEIDDEVT